MKRSTCHFFQQLPGPPVQEEEEEGNLLTQALEFKLPEAIKLPEVSTSGFSLQREYRSDRCSNRACDFSLLERNVFLGIKLRGFWLVFFFCNIFSQDDYRHTPFRNTRRQFHGGPVVRIPCTPKDIVGSVSHRGTKIPQAMWHGQKKLFLIFLIKKKELQ